MYYWVPVDVIKVIVYIGWPRFYLYYIQLLFLIKHNIV